MARMTPNRAVLTASSITAAALAVAAGMGSNAHGDAGQAEIIPVTHAESVEETVFKVDPLHSTVLFRIRHGGHGFFWGRFNKGDGEFFIDEENPSNSFFRAQTDVTSVDTTDEDTIDDEEYKNRRDGHIMAADFLTARQFPTATFESTSFSPTDEENIYELKGEFTLVGVTKPVTARVEYGGTGSFQRKVIQGFEATFEFKRSDFGLTTYLAPDGGEGGGLGNKVRMVIGVEGIKQ